MKTLLKYLGVNKKEVHGDKSPVYTFFAEASSKVRVKAYKKALRGASADQERILERYEREFAHTN